MKRFRTFLMVLACAALGLTACQIERTERRPIVQPGWVAPDRVDACLAPMLKAPMPVHYGMPVNEALTVLGPPHGEMADLSFLRRFTPGPHISAYYWIRREARLYLLYNRRTSRVENLIVVDDDTNAGTEVLLTREELLSVRIREGMDVGRVYAIMGKPTRIEEYRTSEGIVIDRFWYEPDAPRAPLIFIEIDQTSRRVIHISTAPQEETGPPMELE